MNLRIRKNDEYTSKKTGTVVNNSFKLFPSFNKCKFEKVTNRGSPQNQAIEYRNVELDSMV